MRFRNTTSDRTNVAAANDSAFAALKQDGAVVTWGDPRSGGDSSAVAAELDAADAPRVVEIFSNFHAFAALREDGSVVAWGDAEFGGDATAVAAEIGGGAAPAVVDIASNWGAFAALRADGSVVAWGSSVFSGELGPAAGELDAAGSPRVVSISASVSSFAALREDGSVVTWDPRQGPGGSSALVAGALDADGSPRVVSVHATYQAFAALREDGSVVTWGQGFAGGDSRAVASDLDADGSPRVVGVFSTDAAFAALREDGSVTTWGWERSGGDSSAVADLIDAQDSPRVVDIFTNDFAFAALREDGSVVIWGDTDPFWDTGRDDGVIAHVFGGPGEPAVVDVSATRGAFAALREDGSVAVWGDPQSGGDASAVADRLDADGSPRVTRIFSNPSAFAALREDGSLVTWGARFAADAGDAAGELDADGSPRVVHVYGTSAAFAALREDGSVVTWGLDRSGGNSSAVADALSSGVVGLASPFAPTALPFDWLEDAPPSPTFDLSSHVWSITGVDASNTAFEGDLVFEMENPVSDAYALTGYFDWLAYGDISFRVEFEGLIDESGAFRTTSTRLAEAAPGFGAADYTGRLSEDGLTLSGTWAGPGIIPGSWTATRAAPPSPESPLPEEPPTEQPPPADPPPVEPSPEEPTPVDPPLVETLPPEVALRPRISSPSDGRLGPLQVITVRDRSVFEREVRLSPDAPVDEIVLDIQVSGELNATLWPTADRSWGAFVSEFTVSDGVFALRVERAAPVVSDRIRVAMAFFPDEVVDRDALIADVAGELGYAGVRDLSDKVVGSLLKIAQLSTSVEEATGALERFSGAVSWIGFAVNMGVRFDRIRAAEDFQRQTFIEMFDFALQKVTSAGGSLVGAKVGGATTFKFLGAGAIPGAVIGGVGSSIVYSWTTSSEARALAAEIWDAAAAPTPARTLPPAEAASLFSTDFMGDDDLPTVPADVVDGEAYAALRAGMARMAFDAEAYLAENPEAARAVAAGEATSALAHFLAVGAAAGFKPNAGAADFTVDDLPLDTERLDPAVGAATGVFAVAPGAMTGDALSPAEAAIAEALRAEEGVAVNATLSAVANRIARHWATDGQARHAFLAATSPDADWLSLSPSGAPFAALLAPLLEGLDVDFEALRLGAVFAPGAPELVSRYVFGDAGAPGFVETGRRSYGIAEVGGLWVIVADAAGRPDDAALEDQPARLRLLGSSSGGVYHAGEALLDLQMGDGVNAFFGGTLGAVVRGGRVNDVFHSGAGDDVFHLGEGVSRVVGAPGALAGDRITGFGPGDAIQMSGGALTHQDIGVEAGSARLRFPERAGGDADLSLTLEGDFSDARFEVSGDGPDTVIRLAGENAVALPDGGVRYIARSEAGLRVAGGAGSDVIVVSGGANVLTGGGGANLLVGGVGDDVLIATGGDTLRGGGGRDRFVFDGAAAGPGPTVDFVDDFTPGEDVIVLGGFAGIETFDDLAFRPLGADLAIELGAGRLVVLRGLTSADQLGPGDVEIGPHAPRLGFVGLAEGFRLTAADERFVYRGSEELTLDAVGGATVLVGGSGDDVLRGGPGSDLLAGGAGNDRLIGGPGSDTLIGGPGADVFVFSAADARPGAPSLDVIEDFTPGEDRVALIGFEAIETFDDLAFLPLGPDLGLRLTPEMIVAFRGVAGGDALSPEDFVFG